MSYLSDLVDLGKTYVFNIDIRKEDRCGKQESTKTRRKFNLGRIL